MNKQRTNTISIFLLKKDYNENNALKDTKDLVKQTDCSIPNGASLYLYAPRSKNPWWKSYLGIKRELPQSLNGAILFVMENQHHYAVVFGNVSHYLDPNSYEYDFGIIATLNATESKHLKSTDSIEPETAKRNRIQAPNTAEPDYFDIGTADKVFKKISGSIKAEFKEWFSNLTGSDNVRVSTQKKVDELCALCEQLHKLYERTDYKNTFPEFRNICRISEPAKIEKLNALLIDAIKAKDDKLILSVPDNLQYDEFQGVSFGGRTVYPTLLMESFWDFSEKRLSQLTWETFKKSRVRLLNENGTTLKEYSMSRSVIWETELDETPYHFVDGIWYSVEKEYLARLENDLKGVFVPTTFPHNYKSTEAAYNQFVASVDPKYVCLDRSNFGDAGNNLEPCDLYAVENGIPVFVHVKIGVVSARLSHLFNQGLVSLDYLGSDNQNAKEKLCSLLHQKLNDTSRANSYAEALNADRAKVVYAIVCKKDPALGVNALPLFSRIALSKVVKEFRRTKTFVEVQLVKDEVSTEARKKKSAKKGNKTM